MKMRNCDIIRNNESRIVNYINEEIRQYRLRLVSIEIYNCLGPTYDVMFMFSGRTCVDYNDKVSIERICRDTLNEFVRANIYESYTMDRVSLIFND